MCGIVGYIGKNRAIPVVLSGLKNLEYRGYDSAGIAYVLNNKIKIKKEKGKLDNLVDKVNSDIDSFLAIGHTRWATHGEPSVVNAHPHCVGSITLVHNGIIENYDELREEIDYQAVGETDSEVLAAYIDYLYKQEKDILKVLNKLKSILKGSYAIGLIVNNDDSLYCLRKDSPLIIGLGNGENFIASDVPAILEYTNKYYILDNGEYAKVLKDDVKVYLDGKEVKKKVNTFEFDITSAQKNNYKHFMLKEIHDQREALYNTLKSYEGVVLPDLRKYDGITIVGCGSAYYVGMCVKDDYEKVLNVKVDVEIASEFRYKRVILSKKHLVIVISQSGETADTLASLMKAKTLGVDTLAIVNVVGSSIAREAKEVLYIKAGVEKAVATTKAFTCQLLLLLMLVYNKNNYQKFTDLIKDVEITLAKEEYLSSLAKSIYKYNDVFFLGRLRDYAMCLEGSLKLKEVSYIHSEAYAAGELKHGTISLIEEGTPVIAIITDKEIADKTVSNVKEVKARGAYTIVITNQVVPNDIADVLINIDIEAVYLPIIVIIYLQIIAYYVALERGCDIDKPRNLAKSVTVE